MKTLQEQIASYLETLGYGFPEVAKDFLVADKAGQSGTRDTMLVWIPPEPEHEEDIPHLERRLLGEFEDRTRQYPGASRWVVAHTFGGFSQEFARDEAKRHNVNLRVPIQFFDTAFKSDERPDETGSALRTLRYPPARIPQPYSILVDGEPREKGDDLLEHLWQEFRFSKGPSLRIVVGPAGIGKTWLFRTLFSRLYRHFLNRKRELETFPRPIPLIPEFLPDSVVLRTRELIGKFIDAEVAVPVSRATFEWMITHGYAAWLFDGLDELYAGDQDFFQYLTDLLTRSDSQSQILISARESLLTSCETFTDFLDDYGMDPTIHMYRLDGWERPSKHAFAQLNFDPPKDDQFFAYISRSDSLRSLSSLPYYCDLLQKGFKQGKTEEFVDDFTLLDHAVSEIIERERAKPKGGLRPEDYLPNGLNEWLETVASEFFATSFKGIDIVDMEVYAGVVLDPGLSNEERENAITTLIRFPLFAAGIEPGVVAFEHELIAEYLAGRYWLHRLINDPGRVACELGMRIDFADSLIGRYMASQILRQPKGVQALVRALKTEALPGRSFTSLLQLLLSGSPARDLLKKHRISLEGRDLSKVRFIDRDLDGYCFRGCDLFGTVFRECHLQNALFEGSNFAGTKFENLSKGALEGAQFGDLERFEYAYVNGRKIEDRLAFARWMHEATGRTEPILQPCPAALQLRTLLRKFVHADGTGRRSELTARALSRGKRHPKAPRPEDCVEACLRFGYLQHTHRYDLIRRVPGDRYNDMVHFVKDWKLTDSLGELLDSLCPEPDCEHVPEPR